MIVLVRKDMNSFKMGRKVFTWIPYLNKVSDSDVVGIKVMAHIKTTLPKP